MAQIFKFLYDQINEDIKCIHVLFVIIEILFSYNFCEIYNTKSSIINLNNKLNYNFNVGENKGDESINKVYITDKELVEYISTADDTVHTKEKY